MADQHHTSIFVCFQYVYTIVLCTSIFLFAHSFLSSFFLSFFATIYLSFCPLCSIFLSYIFLPFCSFFSFFFLSLFLCHHLSFFLSTLLYLSFLHIPSFLFFFLITFTQSAEAVKYTNGSSAEGVNTSQQVSLI